MIGLLRRLFNNGFVTFCIIVVTFTELGGNKMHTSFQCVDCRTATDRSSFGGKPTPLI